MGLHCLFVHRTRCSPQLLIPFVIKINMKILLSLVSCFLVVVLAQEELRVEVLSQPAQCQLKSKNGDRLTMDYTGTLLDGTQFDTRYLLDLISTLGNQIISVKKFSF